MKDVNKKNEKIFNKVLYLFIVVIGFSFVFVLLINKQQNASLGDVTRSYFKERTIENIQIVARDKDTIYPKYYMALFMDDEYVIHEVNFYETESQFNLEFSRETYRILDYDRSKKMIRKELKVGRGLYSEILNDFASVVGVDNLEILWENIY